MKEDSLIKGIGCTVALIAIILGTILSGIALSIMWGWFIVPTFDVPNLNVPTAIGLSLVVSFLTYRHRDARDDEKDFWEKLAAATVAELGIPLLYLGLGYIVKMFM